MGINSVGGAGNVQMMSIEGLDLESMLMAVQTNRVNLLDQQLKDKMASVQDRNNRISELNTKMTGMNQVLAGETGTALSAANKAAFLESAPQVPDESAMAMRESGAMMVAPEASKPISYLDTYGTNTNNTKYGNQVVKAQMVAAGYPVPTAMTAIPDATGPEQWLTAAQNATFKSQVTDFQAWLRDPNTPPTTKADQKAVDCTTKLQAEAYVKGLQSEIDALGNTQQMEMLGLQSLSNKRNEAFEIMTNFMKKFNDSRAGIIQKF